MTHLVAGSLGLVVAGPFGAILGVLGTVAFARRENRRVPDPPINLVLVLLLIEIRSGISVLAALTHVASALPGYRSLQTVTRVATVSGLVDAVAQADVWLRPIVAQLARAQRTGAPLAGTVLRMLESELASEKARRIARVRALPVRLMIPVTLFMLPGLVLFMYAPSMLAMFEHLTGALT